MTDEEIDQDELQEACLGILIRLNDSTKGNQMAVVQMLMNVTINALVGSNICVGCYVQAIAETLEPVANDQGEDRRHFDVDGSELTKVTNQQH